MDKFVAALICNYCESGYYPGPDRLSYSLHGCGILIIFPASEDTFRGSVLPLHYRLPDPSANKFHSMDPRFAQIHRVLAAGYIGAADHLSPDLAAARSALEIITVMVIIAPGSTGLGTASFATERSADSETSRITVSGLLSALGSSVRLPSAVLAIRPVADGLLVPWIHTDAVSLAGYFNGMGG